MLLKTLHLAVLLIHKLCTVSQFITLESTTLLRLFCMVYYCIALYCIVYVLYLRLY